jgi:hypothetical protein
MSARSRARVFVVRAGMTPHEFVERARIGVARRVIPSSGPAPPTNHVTDGLFIRLGSSEREKSVRYTRQYCFRRHFRVLIVSLLTRIHRFIRTLPIHMAGTTP